MDTEVIENELGLIGGALTKMEENQPKFDQFEIVIDQLRRIADALDWITEHGVKVNG